MPLHPPTASAGQSLIVGRYCVHLHLLKDATKSFARANSIHDGFQRAVTVHDSHYLEIADNVAFRIMAHSFFVEGECSQQQTCLHAVVQVAPHVALAALAAWERCASPSP